MGIRFDVLGEVKGKGRPRFARVGNYVQTYTDKVTVSYEEHIRQSFIASGKVPFPEDTPLSVYIRAYVSIPKSASKKKRNLMLAGKIRPTKKPDPDNIAKSVLDALNKVAYKDDTQVIHLSVSKWYADMPKLEIEIVDNDKEWYG